MKNAVKLAWNVWPQLEQDGLHPPSMTSFLWKGYQKRQAAVQMQYHTYRMGSGTSVYFTHSSAHTKFDQGVAGGSSTPSADRSFHSRMLALIVSLSVLHAQWHPDVVSLGRIVLFMSSRNGHAPQIDTSVA